MTDAVDAPPSRAGPIDERLDERVDEVSAAIAALQARLDELAQKFDVQVDRLLAAQERTNRLLELTLRAGFDAEEELRRR